MISRYKVMLNDVELENISSSILVLDVGYDQPNYEKDTIRAAKRDGARVYGKYKEKAVCTVSFAIREYDIRKRQEVCQRICAWARNGGDLITNDRPGQVLHCVCDDLPAVQSALKWTETLTITFAAYELPYWQDVVAVELELSGDGASGEMYIPGSVEETYVAARITANAAITSFKLQAGDAQITLSDIEIPAGGVVVIDYDDRMIQRIMYGNTSLLDKRSGDDDLIVPCGERCAFSITGNVSVKFIAKGLWE